MLTHEKIEQFRQILGVSRRQLAIRAEVSATPVNDYLNGSPYRISASRIQRLLEILKLDEFGDPTVGSMHFSSLSREALDMLKTWVPEQPGSWLFSELQVVGQSPSEIKGRFWVLRNVRDVTLVFSPDFEVRQAYSGAQGLDRLAEELKAQRLPIIQLRGALNNFKTGEGDVGWEIRRALDAVDPTPSWQDVLCLAIDRFETPEDAMKALRSGHGQYNEKGG
ncbi:helix-turn-helix transcriptional regulator [Sedimenticola selenatireducens]|uniref:helix-turn-helix domain-containing protein n=1 Tax=Sedimenticola selenatireducens TaxID=191960 RepID=UPI002AAB7D26|nr:helix-turn-helix transcriptional regulator [Sedimenticola selenatireducens]